MQGVPTLVALALATFAAARGLGQESRAAETRPAVTFNSKLRLGLVIEDTEPLARSARFVSPHQEAFGITPFVIPRRIPPGATWHVRACAHSLWETGGEPCGCVFSDADLSALVDDVVAKRVPGVSLVGCGQVTDAGIAHLSRGTDLTYLDLGGYPKEAGPDLTDAGLRHLEGLRQLRTLMVTAHWRCPQHGWRIGGRVAGTNGITDAGLASIAKLTALRRLDLSGSYRITGAGVRELAPLVALQSLVLDDAGRADPKPGLLLAMPYFPLLKHLDVSRTEIDEHDFAKILELEGLEWLRIEFCWRLTDDDLKKLATLPKLRRVTIGCLDRFSCKMRITPEGIAALEKLLPDCRVD